VLSLRPGLQEDGATLDTCAPTRTVGSIAMRLRCEALAAGDAKLFVPHRESRPGQPRARGSWPSTATYDSYPAGGARASLHGRGRSACAMNGWLVALLAAESALAASPRAPMVSVTRRLVGASGQGRVLARMTTICGSEPTRSRSRPICAQLWFYRARRGVQNSLLYASTRSGPRATTRDPTGLSRAAELFGRWRMDLLRSQPAPRRPPGLHDPARTRQLYASDAMAQASKR